MLCDMRQDIASIREWLSKEDHLPKDFDDLVLQKFLHSCNGSLEQTKKCIEKFCTYRCEMPELFANRDPLSKGIQSAFTYSYVTSVLAGENELCIYKFDDLDLEKLEIYPACKAFQIQFEYWIEKTANFPECNIFIADFKNIPLRILTKINLSFYKQFLTFAMEAMPFRIKELHFLNCPSYFNKLFALIKPVVPQHLIDAVRIHPNLQSLHKSIDKQYLPIEYGGDAPTLKEQQEYWVKQIEANRNMFLDDTKWRADLSKKPKNKTEETMNGSFRTLAID